MINPYENERPPQAKMSDLDARIKHLKSQKAALETKNNKHTKNERMKRTRTLIQVGGLVSLSGLLERFDMTLGDDLQLDNIAKDKSKILMGILLSVVEQLPQHFSENDLI